MAKITTNVEERVFGIKKWLGVNQAPEGDSRLKFGEAAFMENFKITAGGALQKRPGSHNVAGLMAEYTPIVDTASKVKVFVEYGTPGGRYPMYPRISADSVGSVITEGEAAEVTAENAAEHIGAYYEQDGNVWQLAELDFIEAEGAEKVSGGAITPGSLARIVSGSETNVGGGVSVSGTQQLSVFADLINADGVFTPGGAESIAERAFATAAGWATENVGGYVAHGGKLWRYYGAKTESYTKSYKWKKYKCTRQAYSSSYYRESGFGKPYGSYEMQPGDTYSGGSGYSFNSSTGTFTVTGSASFSYGSSGQVYSGGGSSVNLTSSNGATVYFYSNSAQGPYYSTYYSYSVGDYMNDLLVADGARPESGTMTYVTTTSAGGYSYTIMQDSSGNYYAYRKSDEDTTEYYNCVFGWYGYPLTTESDTYEWYFHPTHTESNDADRIVRGIWSGFVAGREVLCACCNGHLWELFENDGAWSKTDCGLISTAENVHMFGFDRKLWLLNGTEYKVWDGVTLADVDGYRPLVSVSNVPTGGGTSLEQVNKLTGARRAHFSPDGSATEFMLPEQNIASVDYAKNTATGEAIPFTADLAAGKVTFSTAPTTGTNTVEIGWTAAENFRSQVLGMRYAELYNGAQDTRVFIYGDGSNQAFYSDLDSDGNARADYFPDMNVVHVGDSNTPITAMIRHYSRLLAFKLDSAYSIYYDTMYLADGNITAAFYVTTVNRDIGNCAPGQAVLVENRPRTLDGLSVIEWKATSTSGNITGDTRNAERVSQRVAESIRGFKLENAITFYDKISHEYYVVGEDGKALVYNVDADAWYIYTNFDAKRLIIYKDALYFGTGDGWLRHFSTDYPDDEGKAIPAKWESGSMDFGQDYKRKYSAMLWVGLKPEDNGYLKVTAETDQRSDFAEYGFSTESAEQLPEMNRIKLKAKKFTFYKLKLENNTADKTATVVSADIRVRGTGYVR